MPRIFYTYAMLTVKNYSKVRYSVNLIVLK